MIVPVGVVKRRFCAAFARHLVLVLRQLFSQFGVAWNFFRWIHFLRFFFLRLSMTKQNRADNYDQCAGHAEPQSFVRMFVSELCSVHRYPLISRVRLPVWQRSNIRATAFSSKFWQSFPF